jgi:hypothetical protein
MQHGRRESARHEARHALMAAQHNYHVVSCSLRGPQPETIIDFRLGRSAIARTYDEDPEGTAWELERMIGCALVNGEASSASDWAKVVRWERAWPAHAKPSWDVLVQHAQEQVEEWLHFRSTRHAILHFSTCLAVVGHLEGERLAAALYRARGIPHFGAM